MTYSLDRENDSGIKYAQPSLAEMTKAAISLLSANPKGFVLQVEGGKVDWAAHANDAGALIYDQIAFDEAISIVLGFARKDQNTLVIITTDHGNSNPGLFYGSKANQNFDRIQQFKHSNEWILKGITKDLGAAFLIDKIKEAQGYAITEDEAKAILKHYEDLDEQGLYNPRKLPYRELALVQGRYISVGWGAMDHSADFVELAMYGPGSELLNSLVRNFELHSLMLKAAGIYREG